MKILIVSQRYYPESFRITDIAESLVARGHDVTVLTGLPNYPAGRLYQGYEHQGKRKEIVNGVKVLRVREIPRKKGILFRILNYWSFAFYGCKFVKKLDGNFDIVLANELSPIMGCKPAIEYKKRHKTKIVMYEMDLWPESLLAGAIKKGSPIYKHYLKVSAHIYSKFDSILVSTKEHINYIHSLPHCDDLNISYLPQYAEDQFKPNGQKNNSGITNLLFAGNIGKAQSVLTIVKAAQLLADEKNITFNIVGSGSELSHIEEYCRINRINNVNLHGFVPLKDISKYYAEADAFLVSLDNSPYCIMTVPGKIQSYMAVGKPIISCASGATNQMITDAKCGIVCESNDYSSLADNILAFHRGIFDSVKLGSNALFYYKNNFRKSDFIDKLLCVFASLSKKKLL